MTTWVCIEGNVDKVLLRAAEGPYRLAVDTEANEEIELLGPQFAEVEEAIR